MPDEHKLLIEYFIKQTNSRFDKIEGKLDEVIAFRWQSLGALLVINIVLVIAAEMYLRR